MQLVEEVGRCAVVEDDPGSAVEFDIGRQAQVIELSSPELTTRITIRVDRVFAGSGPLGVALSEVSLVGWPADVSDATLARQRARWS